MILPQDTTRVGGQSTAYDTIWAGVEAASQATDGLEGVMLSNDKLYVVLAVVLIIWAGIVFFLFRTDRRLRRLERTLEPGIADEDHRESRIDD